MTSWFWTACGSAAADGLWHPTQSKHRGTPIDRSAVKSDVVGSDFAWTVASPVPARQRGGTGPGRGFDMPRGLAPRGAASPPDLSWYSPRTSPRAACAWARRPHRPHSCLAGHCYRRSSRRWSRAEAKCILVAAGGRALSSASSEPAMWDCVWPAGCA